MSRYIEEGKDERGRFYLETLADPEQCAWLVNDVCCNGLQTEMCADFPDEEYCEHCNLFEPETPETIAALKDGRKTHE